MTEGYDDEDLNEREASIWADGYEAGKAESEEQDPFGEGMQTRYLDDKGNVEVQLKAVGFESIEDLRVFLEAAPTKSIQKIISIAAKLILVLYYEMSEED